MDGLVMRDMTQFQIPDETLNLIGGAETQAASGETFDKLDPSNGKVLCRVARSRKEDARKAVECAAAAQPAWAALPPPRRGEILRDIAIEMKKRRADIAATVAKETGKSFKDAAGETDGAISLGFFFAGEGQRLYGRTMPSATQNKFAATVRSPIGVAGLIIAANTPIANVAWKAFPALICGNAAVVKAAEDTPVTAWLFGKIAHEAGLPSGTLNIIQGYGEEAGAPIVDDPGVGVISFTGSAEVGRRIAVAAGKRLARVSLELGGKNPLVVCDDADLENAVKWALLSAFSNAGQRCASGSRLIVFDSVYDNFRDMLTEKTKSLKVGSNDDDDLGPVINEKQLNRMLAAIEGARERGAKVLAGGHRLDDSARKSGFFLAPTIIENADPDDEISKVELFGPITCLYRVKDFEDAIAIANNSSYGLTACVHTGSLHRAISFAQRVQAGMVVVNAGTYGSEPHMPFGGFKNSGNGSREPGTEALDVYSELKNVCMNINPELA
jgi:aldehyde dehydrogenase (NAD+)